MLDFSPFTPHVARVCAQCSLFVAALHDIFVCLQVTLWFWKCALNQHIKSADLKAVKLIGPRPGRGLILNKNEDLI